MYPDPVNEGVLGAIKGALGLFNVARAGYDSSQPVKRSSAFNYSSAAKAASKLIAVFPVLTSRSISLSTAQLISRYVEQQACIFLQIALQAVNISNSINGMEYLKQFHQNLNIGGTGLDSMMQAMDSYMNSVLTSGDSISGAMSSINASANLLEETTFEISPRDLREIMEMLNNSERYDTYDLELNPISINDYIVSESMGNYTVSLKPILNEAKNNNDKLTHTVAQFADQDVRKINNAVPSLLLVNFYNNTTATNGTAFIIGVKGQIVPVNSDEILRRITNDNKDGKYLINLLRTISGEIRFRDLVLGLSTIDDDIKAIQKKGSQSEIWQMLRNRSQAAKESLKTGKGNVAAAITTVALSQDDCDNLFREENIDITDPKIARHFMDTYNLLGIIIVNDALESMKCMFDDGNKIFTEYAYSTIQRETEDQYRKIINLIDKAH